MVHGDYGQSFLSLHLGFGRLNFKWRQPAIYSERYGFMPSLAIGPLRITWVEYRN